jgi:predicted peptidase
MRFAIGWFLAGFMAITFCVGGSPGQGAKKGKQNDSRNPRYEADYKARVFKPASGEELHYGWLTPLEQKPDVRYPLVICLHGAGGGVKASAVLARKEMRTKYGYFAMVPASDRPYVWAHMDGLLRSAPGQKFPEKLPTLLAAVQALLKSEAIDPKRIYITGQSMGGVGSWGAIARSPELFAAAVPVCGAWKTEDADKMAKVPVWAFHGEKDPTVPVRFSRDLTEAIRKAGGQAKYTEYPGVGHDSWSRAYDDAEMWDWMFKQAQKP